MTIEQMHIGINIRVQKIDSSAFDVILPEEIDYYLNLAIRDFIDEQYAYIKNNNINIASDVVNENLRTLIEETDIPLTLHQSIKRVEGDIPQDYLYYIFSTTTLNNNQAYTNILVQPHVIEKYLDTNSNKPLFRKLPVLLAGNQIKIYLDDVIDETAITKAELTYIKKPKTVDINGEVHCDLPEFTHKRIVDIASTYIIGDISK